MSTAKAFAKFSGGDKLECTLNLMNWNFSLVNNFVGHLSGEINTNIVNPGNLSSVFLNCNYSYYAPTIFKSCYAEELINEVTIEYGVIDGDDKRLFVPQWEMHFYDAYITSVRVGKMLINDNEGYDSRIYKKLQEAYGGKVQFGRANWADGILGLFLTLNAASFKQVVIRKFTDGTSTFEYGFDVINGEER